MPWGQRPPKEAYPRMQLVAQLVTQPGETLPWGQRPPEEAYPRVKLTTSLAILGTARVVQQQKYDWQTNTTLECPPCKLYALDALCVLLTQRKTWKWLIESTIGAVCANATYPLVCCWIQNKPAVANLTLVFAQVVAFVILNSVEYSVLSHSSPAIRGQAVCLFTTCYIVFFVCCSSLILLHILVPNRFAGTNKSCEGTEIEFTLVTIGAATVLRFSLAVLLQMPCLKVYSVRIPSTHMGPCRLVCGSLCSVILIVQGLTLHIYASLHEINASTAMLAYFVAFPLLTYLQIHTEAANQESVWNLWSNFLFVFVVGLMFVWPLCMIDAGLITQQSTATMSCIGVTLTTIGASVLFLTLSAVTSPPMRSFDYMYSY